MPIAKDYLRRSLITNFPALLLICVFMALAAGCAGPLKVNYTAPERAERFTQGAAPSVFVSPLADSRGDRGHKDPKEIGVIEATVYDLNSSRLLIEPTPALLATGALAGEFSAAGYEVKNAPAEADYLLEGELQEFRLDIADRDRVAIAVTAAVKERDTGKVIWSGKAAERADRYAGVMGNSKASIEKYINATLAKVASSVVEQTSAQLAPTHLNRAAQPAPAIQERPQEVAASAGTMSIKTAPERAKVYIGGVYYGLAPLTIELAPGIYELDIRKKGYRNGKEKISVREGETTEVGMELEEE